MLFSLIENADLLFQNRRYMVAGAFVLFNVLIVCILAPSIHTYGASLASHLQSSYSNQTPQTEYQGPDAVTGALSQMSANAGQFTNSVEVNIFKNIAVVANGITQFDKAITHMSLDAVVFSYDGLVSCASLTSHGIVRTVGATVRGVGWVFASTAHGFGWVFALAGHGTKWSFSSTGNVLAQSVSFIHGLTHISSVIRPQDTTPAPTIIQLRAQQAALIQKDTINVPIPAVVVSSGGACDDGNGNGGYPMKWCNAPMDSLATVAYTSDPINRECTSYAYWYFTTVEGNTGLRVWGNAKDWAATSNYPTHASPAVGAIAVETVGAYGHVAIVQALPGQKYKGKVVPDGYVLVSEMNYDWDGHFRYSYSPLSKFSAYIYK